MPDDLWERIEPLLPRWEHALPKLGRTPLPDRLVLQGILFVLHTVIQWEFLPQELGFGSGMTCWRRLAAWNDAGMLQRLHEELLAELNAADKLDWSRAVVDSSHVRRPAAHKRTEPGRPRQTGLQASRDHRGWRIPTAFILNGDNVHDVTQLLPLVEAIPPVRGKPGHPRRRPDELYADRTYDSAKHRDALRAKESTRTSPNVTPTIAPGSG